nr:hypothetical protein [Helicobacter pylori]
MEINPQHQRVIAKTLRDIFIYSKNDSFKVVGDILAMNTPPLTPNQLPLRTLFKIQPKLFIKLAQKILSFRAQDASV